MIKAQQHDRAQTIPAPERLAAIDNAPKPILSKPSHMMMGQRGRWHRHDDRGQLIYPYKGRCRIYTDDRVWIGAPSRAVWVPAGVIHTVQAIDALYVHNIYIDTTRYPEFDDRCHLVLIDSLLEDLLEFSSAISTDAPRYGKTRHYTLHLLADLIRTRRDAVTPQLPISNDRRLRIIMDGLIENPGDGRSLEQWACVACGSSRTLARLFIKETAMTFQQWRQHRRVIAAITLLENGHSISRIASDLGYISQSAFTAMFRRITGRCPTQLPALSATKTRGLM
ncbi:AraC family transcriptional regulator [Brenneria populi]|uniref:AraC family transcriptional regulator n=1 Tax=Brenneria populi TaxID=1505588 RepID=A0ABU6JWY5_9GAMM|nr:AraC family transcriptional regulator [Brenneria populi Li et al. 2015]